MENRAKPIVRKFFLALLTVAALTGAVLVTHSSPAAACFAGGCCYPHDGHVCE
jgi:hypothetical protein